MSLTLTYGSQLLTQLSNLWVVQEFHSPQEEKILLKKNNPHQMVDYLELTKKINQVLTILEKSLLNRWDSPIEKSQYQQVLVMEWEDVTKIDLDMMAHGLTNQFPYLMNISKNYQIKNGSQRNGMVPFNTKTHLED